MAKDAYWFSHDSNARNDEKTVELRMELGWAGYGIYWALIEMLRDAPKYRLKPDCNRIAFALSTEVEMVDSVINKFDLFIFKDDYFFSSSLTARMKGMDKMREKRSKAGRIGGIASAEAKRKQSSSNRQAPVNEIQPSKVKDSKVKDSNPQAIELANLLFDTVKKTYPKTKKPNLEKWADDMDKIMRLDNWSSDDIKKVLAWLPKSDFWAPNIRSAEKLRKQFGRLELEAKKAKPEPKPPELDWYPGYEPGGIHRRGK